MSDRLVLNTVGIKDGADASGDRGPTTPRPASSNLPVLAGAQSLARPRRSLSPAPLISESAEGATRMTAVKLEHDLAGKLETAARAAGVAPDVLAIAALERGLDADQAQLEVHDTRPQHRSRGKLPDLLRRGLPEDPRVALGLVMFVAAVARATAR
jgi:hypothetical protein